MRCGATPTWCRRQLPAATQAYTDAIARNDGFFYYYLQRGLIAENTNGRTAHARQDLETSVKLLPTGAAYYALGNIASRARNLDAARQYYAAAAGSEGEIGQAAGLELMRLELPQNPGKYIRAQAGARSHAACSSSPIGNPTRVPVTGIAFAIQYVDAQGRMREMRRNYRRYAGCRAASPGRDRARPVPERAISSRSPWPRRGSRSDELAPAGGDPRGGRQLATVSISDWRQDEFAILDRDALARVAVHADDLLDAIEFIGDVESRLHRARVEDDRRIPGLASFPSFAAAGVSAGVSERAARSLLSGARLAAEPAAAAAAWRPARGSPRRRTPAAACESCRTPVRRKRPSHTSAAGCSRCLPRWNRPPASYDAAHDDPCQYLYCSFWPP